MSDQHSLRVSNKHKCTLQAKSSDQPLDFEESHQNRRLHVFSKTDLQAHFKPSFFASFYHIFNNNEINSLLYKVSLKYQLFLLNLPFQLMEILELVDFKSKVTSYLLCFQILTKSHTYCCHFIESVCMTLNLRKYFNQDVNP